MAKKTVKIAGLGPFIYDDAEREALQTDGDISVGSITSQESPTAVTNAESPYAVNSSDIILVDASGGDVTINLPATSGNADIGILIKRTDSSANIVTVDANSTELIEDTETKELRNGDAMRIVNDETQWWIV